MSKKKLPSLHKAPGLEKTLFEYLCIIQVTLMLCLTIQDIVLLGFSWIILANVLVGFIGLLFFYLSRYKGIFNPLRIPLILFLMIAIVFFWTVLGGYTGLLSVIALGIGLVIIIIGPVKYRLLYSCVIPLELIILTILQSTGMITVGVYPPEVVPLNYLLFSLSTMALVFLLKVEFDNSRSKTEQQNLRLNSLNDALQSIINEKEKYIGDLQSTQNQLVESEKMATLGRLTAGLAHELNNPLNFIGGSVAPIKEDLAEIQAKLTPEQASQLEVPIGEITGLLENIKEGSQRSIAVINNLLQVSPKAKEKNTEPTDVTLLTKRTCTLMENAFPHIEIVFRANDTARSSVNSTEINQVLLNLLNNAVAAISKKEAPRIEVTVAKTSDRLKIIVRDNGPGVEPKNVARIFEPFFSTKEEGRGTGLGLYISYGIIRKHGGELSYDEQSSGKGACFQIELPLIEQTNHF